MNLIDKQKSIEAAASTDAIRKQQRDIDRAEKQKVAGSTKAGSYFTRNLHAPLIQPIHDFMTVKKDRRQVAQ